MHSFRDILQASASGAVFLVALYALSACADIAPHDNGDAGVVRDAAGADASESASRYVRFVDTGAGAGTLFVDASDAERWVYVDLDAQAEVQPADPAGDPTWDLAFRRFHVASNGGVSGTGGVSVARVDGLPFVDVTLPSAASFETDRADGEDDDALPDYVFSGGVDPWYAYDVETHVLTPKTRVYVLRTTAGAAVKVAVERYYDDAGGSGHPTLRYARVPTP